MQPTTQVQMDLCCNLECKTLDIQLRRTPAGATPLVPAFAISTDIGKCAGSCRISLHRSLATSTGGDGDGVEGPAQHRVDGPQAVVGLQQQQQRAGHAAQKLRDLILILLCIASQFGVVLYSTKVLLETT